MDTDAKTGVERWSLSLSVTEAKFHVGRCNIMMLSVGG